MGLICDLWQFRTYLMSSKQNIRYTPDLSKKEAFAKAPEISQDSELGAELNWACPKNYHNCQFLLVRLGKKSVLSQIMAQLKIMFFFPLLFTAKTMVGPSCQIMFY